jgi:hypothetical protein
MLPDKYKTACYKNQVPHFVEAEMDRLYGNIFSTLEQFRIYGWTGTNTHTYVAQRGESIATILLYEIRNSRVLVKNEGIRLSKDDIARFAETIFKNYPQANVITFNAIETDIHRIAYPCQRFNYLEDLTIDLPATPQDYLASLGKNTRRNVKRYTDRAKRTFPSLRFDVYEKDAINEEHIRALIEFNRERMADKNIASVIDEEETRRIIKLAKACGLVGLFTIDGRVVAGALSWRAGSNYFLNVLAHDPKYDDYWLGFLCCYMTIGECILRGGKEFHFLWGRYDYKIALGAVQRDLDNVAVYRSRFQFLLNGNLAWKTALAGYMRRAKLWCKYEDTFFSQKARKLVARGHEFKRTLSALPKLAVLASSSREG